jgi:hypothetical protein
VNRFVFFLFFLLTLTSKQVLSKSMLITLVPFATKLDTLDSVLSLTGEIDGQMAPVQGEAAMGSYPSAEIYERVLGLRNLARVNALGNGQLALPSRVNTMCCMGAHKLITAPNTFGKVRLNTGHHGPNVIVGSAKIRNGVMEELKKEAFN